MSVGEIAVRVDHDGAFAGNDVGHGKIEEKRALAGAGFPTSQIWRSRSSRVSTIGAPFSAYAIAKGSVSIPSRQPPVMTRSASAARVCRRAHFPTCGGRENAARRATHGEV